MSDQILRIGSPANPIEAVHAKTMQLNDGNAVVGYVWTATDTNGNGHWALSTGGSGSPGGSNEAVQFNNAGSFDGDSTNFFWNNTNKQLVIGAGTSISGALEVYQTNGVGGDLFFLANGNGADDGAIMFKSYNTSPADIINIQGTNGAKDALTNITTQVEGGNFGVGTYIPTEKLEVSGAIRATGSAVSNGSNATDLDFSGGESRIIARGPDNATPGTFALNLVSADASAGGDYVRVTPGNLQLLGVAGNPTGLSLNQGDNSNGITVFAPTTGLTGYNLTLPNAQGIGALSNDGAGNLSWVENPNSGYVLQYNNAPLTTAHALFTGGSAQPAGVEAAIHFTPSQNTLLKKVGLYLSATAGTTGAMVCWLIPGDGTPTIPDDSKPPSDIANIYIDVSDTPNANTLGTSPSEFIFTFTSLPELSSTQDYWLLFVYYGVTGGTISIYDEPGGSQSVYSVGETLSDPWLDAAQPFAYSLYTAQPDAGFFRLDNADPSLATSIVFSGVSKTGSSLTPILSKVLSGSQIHISGRAGDVAYQVNGVSTHGAFEIADVSYLTGGGSLINNEYTSVDFGAVWTQNATSLLGVELAASSPSDGNVWSYQTGDNKYHLVSAGSLISTLTQNIVEIHNPSDSNNATFGINGTGKDIYLYSAANDNIGSIELGATDISLYGDYNNGTASSTLKFWDAWSDDFVALKAPTSLGGTTTTYTLPSVDGTDGQVLKTNGAGVMSWGAGSAEVTKYTVNYTDFTSFVGLDNGTKNITTIPAGYAITYVAVRVTVDFTAPLAVATGDVNFSLGADGPSSALNDFISNGTPAGPGTIAGFLDRSFSPAGFHAGINMGVVNFAASANLIINLSVSGGVTDLSTLTAGQLVVFVKMENLNI